MRNIHVLYMQPQSQAFPTVQFLITCMQLSVGVAALRECSALWGEHEGVAWCVSILQHYLFPLVYISHKNSLIPRSSPPPSVACKTGGCNAWGRGQQMYAGVHRTIQLGYVLILGSLYTLFYYWEMVATNTPGIWRCSLKSCKLRMSIQNLSVNKYTEL